MRKIFAYLLLFLLPFLIFAESIDKEKNKLYATMAFQQKTAPLGTKSVPVIADVEFLIDQGDTVMAIYNFIPEGFIIMSTNDVSFPIIGYSDKGHFSINDASPSMRLMLDEYKEEIRHAKAIPDYDYVSVQNAWKNIEKRNAKGIGSIPVIGPLISATWNQDKYYNQLSPIDFNSPSGYDNKVPNGCVALTMAMIMYYYRYPSSGNGSKTNATNYGNFTVNFEEESYNYDLMLDQLSTYNYEVAKLIFHAATSVSMKYSPDGSSAYSHDVPTALKTYFNYDNSAKVVYRSSYSPEEWHNIIINQLNQKRPIYYSGVSSDGGGHAFICDGYDSDTLFHFNFGWGGIDNGYYVINSTASSAGGYYRYQDAVIDIFPKNSYPEYCSHNKLLTAYNGTLEDGSGNEDYVNNMECTYIIAPPYATSFDINIQYLSTEAGHDSLSFWKGNPVNGQLVTSLSGTYSDYNLSISTDSLYITFHTNDNITDEGWRFTYQVNHSNQSCRYTDIFTSHSGTFTDRINDHSEYGPNLECEWIIQPRNPLADNITISFSELDIAPNDILTIYNAYNQKVVYATYTGINTIPPVATYPTPRLNIKFSTDNYLQSKGFTITWWDNSVVDLPGYEENTDISIFPNPASNYIRLLFDDQASGKWEVCLYDITGKVLLKETIYPIESQCTEINISDLKSGIYLLRFTNGQDVINRKVVIQK